MKRVNEGDIIEGVFAIACSLYLSNGTVTKTEINSIRRMVNPTIATNARQLIPVGGIDLAIKIRSPRMVTGAFGAEFDGVNDIGKIDRKIDTLIRKMDKSRYIAKLDRIISSGSKEKITVVADGTSTDKEEKGDVYISRGTKKLASFSLKSKSKTLSNRAPVCGMIEVADKFGVRFSDVDFYIENASRVAGNQDMVFGILRKMFRELGEGLEGANISSDTAIDFLHRSLHGTDSAFLIDINSGVKELDPVDIIEFGESINLKPVLFGQTIRFMILGTDKCLFQLRLKLRTTSSGITERKLYVELRDAI